MKVKFTKLAALLLAGVALFATGCTDYEVDIQRVDSKVNNLTTEVNGKIASLEQQIAGINATIATLETEANHKADIDKLNKTISDLETALRAALDTKVDKEVYAAKMAEINGKIQALEAADESFKTQIADLVAELAKKVNQTDFDKAVADFTAAINGEISRAKAAEAALQAAIDKINNETIPALQAQVNDIKNVKIPALETEIENLKTGKVDKTDFEAYKTATAATIALMQEAIQNLADTKLDKTEFETKIAEIIAKFDDYVLVKDFEEFKKIAATKAELAAVKAELEGRIKVCEDLLAGDWGDQTVQEYIDAKAKGLQNQIDNIVNNLLPELTNRVAALEKNVNEVILPQLQFALDYEGGLKAYIDDAAQQAYEDAVDYVDAYMEFLIDQLNEIFSDIYKKLDMVLQRIQSIQFVPEYDDLKITTNMSFVYQEGSQDGIALAIDQPTKVTYQFLPAQYAGFIAQEVQENIIKWQNAGIGGYTRDELKANGGYDGLIAYFDVRPVDTRDAAAVEGLAPKFEIIAVDSYDNETGEITFTVQPVGVASAQYAANGIKPVSETYLTDAAYDPNYGILSYPLFSDADGTMWYTSLYQNWVHYAYDINDLKAYEARTAFVAQLRLYRIQDWEYATDNYPDYRDSYGDPFPVDYDDDGYADYENELASPYNVLYPAVSEIEILDDPFRKEDDGSVRPFTEDEIWQTLPYSALRKDGDDAIGEKPEQDPKGYRIILDQAVPVVSIDGAAPVSIEAAAKAGYIVPPISTDFKEFKYYDSEWEDLADELKANFVETPKVYAEFEMNEAAPASQRKKEVGDIIVGTYEFKSVLGAFTADGYVEITKPEGSVKVSADIKWVYAQDADTDHERYYNDETAAYTHVAEPVTIDEESAATLESTLGITVADFDHKTPVKVVITDSEGNDVTDVVSITAVTITEDGLTFDITGFEWDETYTLKADYDLDAAVVTVNGTITTTDRNRELIEVDLGTYKFVLNGEEYDAANDTYTSEPIEFQEPLFDKFVANGIINQGEPKDFEDADDFVGVDHNGKEGHLRVVTDAEGNSIYLVIADDNATIICTSPELKEIMGTEQFIYVTTYTGQLVKVKVVIDVDLPVYDFLHLSVYTFNTDTEFAGDDVVPFIQKDDFDETENTIKWWTRVQPSYFNGEYNEFQEKISNRYALKQYDVAYINLAELAFNVVDKDDKIMDEAAIEEAHLVVKFDYTDETQSGKPIPAASKTTGIETYADLWIKEANVETRNQTVFYYRTNEKPFIQMKGHLAILSGETEFPLVTRFDKERASVQYPAQVLDYSKYALVRWTPFVKEQPEDLVIVLDENKIYREPLFSTINLKDNRPNNTTFSVIENGEWVLGDAAADATRTSESNGYVTGTYSNVAYDIKEKITYDELALPVQLRKLLSVEEIDGVPYVVYNYTSEVQFQGVVTIPVTVSLVNPWQAQLDFTFNVVIKGFND